MKTYNSYTGFEAYEHVEVCNASQHDMGDTSTGSSHEDWDVFFPDAAF